LLLDISGLPWSALWVAVQWHLLRWISAHRWAWIE